MWTLSFVQAALLVGLGIAYMQAYTSTTAQALAVFFVMAFVLYYIRKLEV
jgi:hypothetical protein